MTVSVALNGSTGGTQVSEATRQRIVDAARQLGYIPSARSRALRERRTDILGFFVGFDDLDVHHPFTADLVNGLQNGSRAHGKDLLLFGGFVQHTADEVFAALTSGRIDGLVVVPSPRNPMIERLADSHLHIVGIANPAPNMPCVVADDFAGGRLLAQHLYQRGHRLVLYRTDPQRQPSTQRRQRAFADAAASLGLQVCFSCPQDWEGRLSADELAELSGFGSGRPTAAVCWSDVQARTLLDECGARGIRVPQDLAIVGFNGVETLVRAPRQLTTVRAGWYGIAEKAVAVLMAEIAGGEVPRETVMPVELVVGDTT